jgi:hypothetical protein
MPKRKTEDDKFALVIWSALREWNLQPTMEECLAAIKYLKQLMAVRHATKLPRTFEENIQTKG